MLAGGRADLIRATGRRIQHGTVDAAGYFRRYRWDLGFRRLGSVAQRDHLVLAARHLRGFRGLAQWCIPETGMLGSADAHDTGRWKECLQIAANSFSGNVLAEEAKAQEIGVLARVGALHRVKAIGLED